VSGNKWVSFNMIAFSEATCHVNFDCCSEFMQQVAQEELITSLAVNAPRI
jgi:hypothetical protein